MPLGPPRSHHLHITLALATASSLFVEALENAPMRGTLFLSLWEKYHDNLAPTSKGQ